MMTNDEWIQMYWHLIDTKQWEALVDHVRFNVNQSKEILLNIDPEAQKHFHTR